LVINIKIIKIFYLLFYITMLKDLQKTFKAHHVLLLLGGLVLIYVIYNYSSNKNFYPENYETVNRRNSSSNSSGNQNTGSGSGGTPTGANDNTFFVDYAPINSTDGGMAGMPSNCNSQNTNSPSDLLPSDSNSGWGLKPMGSGDFLGVNFLNAGYLIGIDSVGSSLRNANQQVRSEPPNPQLMVSPWNNTTIEPDSFRQPLEVGCGPQ
jgi:hypothetical protein